MLNKWQREAKWTVIYTQEKGGSVLSRNSQNRSKLCVHWSGGWVLICLNWCLFLSCPGWRPVWLQTSTWSCSSSRGRWPRFLLPTALCLPALTHLIRLTPPHCTEQEHTQSTPSLQSSQYRSTALSHCYRCWDGVYTKSHLISSNSSQLIQHKQNVEKYTDEEDALTSLNFPRICVVLSVLFNL